MAASDAVKEAIRRAAEEDGIDPATALAYAERESSFNPNAHNSRTIYGLYQMTGDLRHKYGMGDSSDPYTQTKAFNRLLMANKATMASRLGRDVTDTEAYYGHHFGAGRAARMLGMDPNTPVSEVFTPNERALNPHFDRAGTVGSLLSSVGGDLDRRRSNYGGSMDFSGSSEQGALDFSQFAEPADTTMQTSKATQQPLDFSQFAEPA